MFFLVKFTPLPPAVTGVTNITSALMHDDDKAVLSSFKSANRVNSVKTMLTV